MIVCFTLLSVGCLGSPPNEYGDDFNEDDFEDSEVVEMYGTKVLYRPEDYDYNEGSGATEGQENDYYGKYAYYIMRDLFSVYGRMERGFVVGSTDTEGRLPNFSDGIGNDVWAQDMTSYLYDSIRYQVDTVAQISQAYIVTYENGQITEISETPTDLTSPIYIVGADTNVKWNWSLVANPTGEGENIKAYAYNTATGGTPIQQGGKVFINSTTAPSETIANYYGQELTFASSYYQDLYLTTSDSDTPENDYDLYKDKTLRAYGTLANCHILKEDEMIELLSLVKLGQVLGFIDIISDEKYQKLYYEGMSANLKEIFEFSDKKKENIIRAEYISNKVRELTKGV